MCGSSAPDPHSWVVGLGYRNHGFPTPCEQVNGFFNVQDATTCVVGWAFRDFVYAYCD